MNKTTNQRIRANLVAILSLAILGVVPSLAVAQVTTLDDFDSRYIKRQFWDGLWTGRTLDTSRRNGDGKLILAMRAYGDLAQSSGRDSAGEGVSVNPIIARRWSRIESRVRITAAQMRDCASNAEPTRVQIRIFGRMFADVVDPGNPSGDDTDKVIGYIALERRSTDDTNRLRAKYWAGLCKDPDCDVATTVASGEFGRTVGLGQWANLIMENDIDNRTLKFGVNGIERSRDYSAVVASPVTLDDPVMRIQLDTKTPHCLTSVRTRPYADLKGEVDWVRINADALN